MLVKVKDVLGVGKGEEVGFNLAHSLRLRLVFEYLRWRMSNYNGVGERQNKRGNIFVSMTIRYNNVRISLFYLFFTPYGIGKHKIHKNIVDYEPGNRHEPTFFWVAKSNKILFPNFFPCSVTPCMLTMTMLPERMLVCVHYLAHNRL